MALGFIKCCVCWRSRIRCYGPTSHRKGGREVREGEEPMTKVGRMSSGTCTCEARTEGKCAKPRCMIKGSARDEWGRFSSVAHGVVLVDRVRGAGICQHNLRVPDV